MKSIIALLVSLFPFAGSALAQCGDETLELFAGDGMATDYFGTSLALSGSTLIVAASSDDNPGIGTGSAYLFDVATGNEISKLLPQGSTEQVFGSAVAISGGLAVVGALGDDVNVAASGSAYLFDATNGDLIRKLLADDGEFADHFGVSVGIQGQLVIVGAHDDDAPAVDSGSAYLFEASTGQQLFKLVPSDPVEDGSFGRAVATDGVTGLVGAPGVPDHGALSGAAYLFDVSTGQQTLKLSPADGGAGELFGISVAIDGAIAVVGARADQDLGTDSGSVYVFDVSSGALMHKLLAPDGQSYDEFGDSVGISGTTIVVGSHQLFAPSGSGTGKVYLFDAITGLPTAQFLPSDAMTMDAFGAAVAISGTTVAAGSFLDDDLAADAGSVYLFRVEEHGSNYCASNPNSTGGGAIMFACGSPSLADNHLTISARGVPDRPYLFFHGPNQIQAPFGDGFLCVGGGVTRLGPAAVATGQLASRTLDLASDGIVLPGTYNFQCWFRDSAPGAGFSTSDGLAIDLVP